MGKTVAGKPEIIREVDKNKRSKSEVAQEYGIPLSTLLIYLKSGDCIEQQALQGGGISKRMIICGIKHGNMENELFEFFFHA
jgi:hypothetical protein